MKKSKYRIYTIAPSKGLKRFAATVIIPAVMILGMLFAPKPGSRTYNFFARKSISSVFMKKNSEHLFGFGKHKIKIHTILNQLSPVFAKTQDSTSLHKSEEKPKGTVMAEQQVQKVNEKTITSQAGNIKNETNYDLDTEKLVNMPREYSATGNEPRVLVIHTHGCETYSDENGIGLGEKDEYRTVETDKNMIKIGEVITEVFKEKGINVIHDKTLCDYPNYNSSYVKSLEVIESYLLKYPTIEFVFDIHRDAIAAEDGTPTKLICKINNETCAQAMIVCGTDAMGLENPNWQENLILALKIQKNLEEKYPGLMRPVNIRKERFNMHKTKGSLLFEVGSHGNTLEEAIKGAKYLAEGIAETILTKSEE